MFCFQRFSNRQNFYTTEQLLPSKNEIVSIYFQIKTEKQMRPKISETLRAANSNPKFAGYKKKSVVDMERRADS